jgi:hypothetical protein
MRRDQHIRQFMERSARRPPLWLGRCGILPPHIERGAAKAVVFQRGIERILCATPICNKWDLGNLGLAYASTVREATKRTIIAATTRSESPVCNTESLSDGQLTRLELDPAG